ncbi:MAG: transglycosylase SLT domain-containing protein [Bdellovibrionales bacterium]|nr:transglycosylase SLT domain-containing protein [Bdellovibrionales bacterium]
MFKLCLFLLFATSLPACVGPVTPFGPLNSLKLKDGIENEEEFSGKAFFRFYPERQILHARSPFKVILTDPDGIPNTAQIKAFYQGSDITLHLMQHAKITKNSNTWTIDVQRLELTTQSDHSLTFKYIKNPSPILDKIISPQNIIQTQWKPPYCDLFSNAPIQTTFPFKPKAHYLESIQKWSTNHKLNPNLVAALVAQESSFNPKAISWSKAIGLTQVTPIADLQIQEFKEEWPRAPEIKKLPILILKPLVSTGQLTSKDDWRLNPDLSIQGGILYLEYLVDYWGKPQNLELIQENLSQNEYTKTNLILASYNSGAARVAYAIKTNGENYLNSDNLSEAKKYVRKISSYCFHFSQQGQSE